MNNNAPVKVVTVFPYSNLTNSLSDTGTERNCGLQAAKNNSLLLASTLHNIECRLMSLHSILHSILCNVDANSNELFFAA